MMVMCTAVTCKHNSLYLCFKHLDEFGEKPILGKCNLEIIVLRDVEREDYKDDVMACALYKRGGGKVAKENRECTKAHA